MNAEVEHSLHGEVATYAGGVHEVADGCLAYLQPNGGLGEANVGLVVGDGATLIIDTCWDHAQARRMLAAAAPWLHGNPITTVVNTHSNGDHWWGNAVMPAAATVITSAASRAAMGRENRLAIAAMTTAAGLAARLPLPQAIRSFVTDAHAEFGPFDFWRVRPRYPDRTFSGSLRLTVGNRTVDLVEVGPAHTPGDLMVFDRDRNVVFAGDILFIGQTPIMWEGPARNWIDALRLILDTRPAAIVPGHGPLATETDVTDLVSYFEWLDDSATRLCRNGIPPFDAAAQMLSSDTFTESRWARWRRPESLLAGVRATYRHVRGHRVRIHPLDMIATMRGIQKLGNRFAKDQRRQ